MVLSTVTSGYDVDSVNALNRIIIVDGNSNPRQFDGSSSATIAGMPICKYVEFMHESVFCANIPSVSTSRVAKSSVSSATNWTVPGNVADVAGDPNTFDFQRDDGEGINCLKATPWGLVVGKRHSMHILKGIDNLTFYKRIIDPAIGCVDDRSMQMVDGNLVWLAVDGVYAWQGAGPPELLSNDITPLIKQIRQLNSVAGIWIVDSEGEWELGSFDTNGPSRVWDSNSVSGSIFVASTSFIDTNGADFVAGELGLTNAAVDVDTITVSGGALTIAKSTTSSYNLDPFTDTNITSSPAWTTADSCMTTAVKDGSRRLVCDCSSCSGGTMTTPSTATYGRWAFDYLIPTGESVTGAADLLLANYEFLSGGPITYSLRLYHPGVATNQVSYRFYRDSTQVGASKILNITPGTATTFSAVRTSTGAFSIYFGTATELSATYSDTPAPTQIKIFVYRYNATSESNSFDNISIPEFKTAGVFYSRVFDTSFSTPIGGPITVSSTIASGIGTLAFQVRSATSSSGEWLAWANMTNEVSRSTQARRYQQYLSSFTTTASTVAPYISDITQHFIATGNYRSEVHQIGSRISLWRSGDWTDSLSPAGILQYFVRSASYSFVAGEDLLTWSTMTNHNTITIATNTYFQFRVQSSSMTSSSQTASMSRFAANWQEGTEKPVASGTLDHRYFLCVALSSTSVINDTCLVLQKNNKWVKYTGPSLAAMTIYDNNLVAGSGNTDSYAWKIMQADVYRDDNAAINSFWTTKDYTGKNPFHDKIYHEAWIDAEVATSSVTVGVATNKSSSFSNKTLSLDVTGSYINKRVAPSTGYALGRYHKLKFTNSTIDQYFRINRFMFWSETKARTQE